MPRRPSVFVRAVVGSVLDDVVLDGEIVAMHEGRPAFAVLAGGSRTRAAAGVVAYFVALDLLTEDDRDHRALPYRERRVRPEEVIAGARPPLQVVPSTTDREQALTWIQPQVSVVGIEGLNRRTPTRGEIASLTPEQAPGRRLVPPPDARRAHREASCSCPSIAASSRRLATHDDR